MYTHTKKREQSTSKVGSKKIKWFSQGFRISQKRTRSTHKKGLNETFQNIIFFGAAKSCYYFYARFIIIYFFCFGFFCCFCTFVVISLFQHFIIYLALFANILFECRDCFLTENWFYTFFHYNICFVFILISYCCCLVFWLYAKCVVVGRRGVVVGGFWGYCLSNEHSCSAGFQDDVVTSFTTRNTWTSTALCQSPLSEIGAFCVVRVCIPSSTTCRRTAHSMCVISFVSPDLVAFVCVWNVLRMISSVLERYRRCSSSTSTHKFTTTAWILCSLGRKSSYMRRFLASKLTFVWVFSLPAW